MAGVHFRPLASGRADERRSCKTEMWHWQRQRCRRGGQLGLHAVNASLTWLGKGATQISVFGTRRPQVASLLPRLRMVPSVAPITLQLSPATVR